MLIRLWQPSGCTIEYYEKTASTTFTFNDVAALSTAGRLIRYTAGGAFPILGLIQTDVVSTDSDYASTTREPILVCDENATYLCDVSTGTAAITDVGEYIDFDDENSVDVDATANNELYVTLFVSTTQVVAKFVRKLPRVFE